MRLFAVTFFACCVLCAGCAGGGGGMAAENEVEVSVGDGPGKVRVSWLPPEQNVDGTEFSDLQEYRIYVSANGQTSGYVRSSAASMTLTGLPEGEIAFNVTAVNSGGNESIPSERIAVENK